MIPPKSVDLTSAANRAQRTLPSRTAAAVQQRKLSKLDEPAVIVSLGKGNAQPPSTYGAAVGAQAAKPERAADAVGGAPTARESPELFGTSPRVKYDPAEAAKTNAEQETRQETEDKLPTTARSALERLGKIPAKPYVLDEQ